jgi:hypothetical protein
MAPNQDQDQETEAEEVPYPSLTPKSHPQPTASLSPSPSTSTTSSSRFTSPHHTRPSSPSATPAPTSPTISPRGISAVSGAAQSATSLDSNPRSGMSGLVRGGLEKLPVVVLRWEEEEGRMGGAIGEPREEEPMVVIGVVWGHGYFRISRSIWLFLSVLSGCRGGCLWSV